MGLAVLSSTREGGLRKYFINPPPYLMCKVLLFVSFMVKYYHRDEPRDVAMNDQMTFAAGYLFLADSFL